MVARVCRQQDRPNVLIALSDYQALNVMSVIPETLARLEENSVNYISTVSTTPLCAVGPRASSQISLSVLTLPGLIWIQAGCTAAI